MTNELISEILFKHDPASTACVENSCFDEYDFIANAISCRLLEIESATTRAEIFNAFEEELTLSFGGGRILGLEAIVDEFILSSIGN